MFASTLTCLKKNVAFLAVLLLTFFVVKNAYSQQGIFQTHDGQMHLIRSLHFFSELKKGQFPVRVSSDLAYQYSYPVFQYFYPLPYYTVGIFQLIGLSTTESWRFVLSISTFLSLWFFYKWMRCSFKNTPSLIATTIYALVPFRFLTLFVTGQIGGYFALVFAPLIGWGLYNLLKDHQKNLFGGSLIALGIAGMILSHLLSVIIFFIPLASYGAYLLFTNFSWDKFRKLILWVIVGLGLSSFYLIPFLFEKSTVKLGQEVIINHQDHWPAFKQLIYSPWGHGYSLSGVTDGLSFQVGLTIITTWFISFLVFLINKKKKWLALIMTLTFSFIFFLMLKQSSFLWEIFFPLQYLQYPWRLLASTSLVGAWLTGWILDNLSNKKSAVLGLLLVALAVINARNYTKPWPLDWKTDEDFIADKQNYYGSTDISWELMPASAVEVPKDLGDEILSDSREVIINYIQRPNSGKTRLKFIAISDQPANLILPVWNYPYWLIKINGETVKTSNNIGKIEIKINSGESAVELILIKTKTQRIADLISLSFFVIMGTIILKNTKNGS